MSARPCVCVRLGLRFVPLSFLATTRGVGSPSLEGESRQAGELRRSFSGLASAGWIHHVGNVLGLWHFLFTLGVSPKVWGGLFCFKFPWDIQGEGGTDPMTPGSAQGVGQKPRHGGEVPWGYPRASPKGCEG